MMKKMAFEILKIALLTLLGASDFYACAPAAVASPIDRYYQKR